MLESFIFLYILDIYGTITLIFSPLKLQGLGYYLLHIIEILKVM